jgi:hypothetical protein
MLLILQILTVFLVAVAMSLALAHALELPGKMRLDKQTYIAVQAILGSLMADSPRDWEYSRVWFSCS